MFDDCKSLNDAARKFFGKANYTNREKVKKILAENGVNWEEWLAKIKESKTKYCLVCGKKLEKDQVKFCSHSCSASYNNTLREKKLGNTCLECGKEIEDIRSNRKFCCNECQREHEYKRYIEKWKNGEASGMRSATLISQHVRRYLLEKTNCSCEICGCNWVNPKSGNPIVQIHHIDGNAFNNKEENLQVLCPNHHAMTETFGNNNENGRAKRLKEIKFLNT